MAGTMEGFKQFSSQLSSSVMGLFSSGNTAVGLSIGSSSIKIVEIERSGSGWRLLHFGVVQLQEEVIVNREIVNQLAVVENIRNLTSQIKLKSKQVCSALSGTSLIIKRLSIDVPNPRELHDQIMWEAEQYIPYDLSEVVVDYQVLSRSKDNKTDVLLVAVKRAILENYISVVEDSGLKAKVIDVDFFALQNLFEINYVAKPSEAVGIVDIGASALKMVIVHGGIPVFTKDTAIGGRNLTAEIQKHLSLSYADAEALKTSGGKEGGLPQEVSELMSIMSENFAAEIKRALDFYSASSSGAPVAYLLVTGGSSKIPGLARLIEERVGLPTQLVNPFNAISYDPGVFTQEYLSSIAPIAAVPLGLALRAGAK